MVELRLSVASGGQASRPLPPLRDCDGRAQRGLERTVHPIDGLNSNALELLRR